MPFQRLSEMTVSAVSWLVPYWLPRGKMAILDGNPGKGKSMIALDLCARAPKREFGSLGTRFHSF